MFRSGAKLLALAFLAVSGTVGELCTARKFDEALARLATVRRPLDEFFDKVMVMAEDEKVRLTRLALLQQVATMFQAIADFSEVVTVGKAS